MTALALEGVRFGSLTGVRVLDSDKQGRRWLFRCDCGREAIRYAGAIRQSVRAGNEPACTRCRKMLARFKTEDRLTNTDRWFTRLELFGTLYSLGDEIRLSKAVGEALEEEGHEPPLDAEQFNTPFLFREVVPRPANVRTAQRAAFLYPVDAGEDGIFQCVHCKSESRRMLGCVQCLEPVCSRCIRQERHTHAEECGEYEWTLEAIGKHYGLSTERVRQVEAKGLRRLRTRNVRREVGDRYLASVGDDIDRDIELEWIISKKASRVHIAIGATHLRWHSACGFALARSEYTIAEENERRLTCRTCMRVYEQDQELKASGWAGLLKTRPAWMKSKEVDR